MGVRIKLDAATDVGNIVLYSGIASHTDVLKVYAAEKLEDLYKAESLVKADIACNGTAVTVPVGRKIQYVAVFVTQYKDGCWRVKEIEIYKNDGTVAPAEPEDPGTGGGSGSSDSLLFMLVPDKAGVTTEADYETLSGTGGPFGFEGLTDGIIIDPSTGRKQNAQFWNGKKPGAQFVFTYIRNSSILCGKTELPFIPSQIPPGPCPSACGMSRWSSMLTAGRSRGLIRC